MPKIERMLKWGSGEWLSLLLECGHRRKVRRAEAKAQQWSPGRHVACVECERALAVSLRKVRPAVPMTPEEARRSLRLLAKARGKS